MGAYCPICGNRGITPDGEVCTCQIGSESTMFAALTGMEVPAQYQGVIFNYSQVPSDIAPAYGNLLIDLHARITTMQLVNQNIVICAPPLHSKTVWVYSCLQHLYRAGAEVLPFYDLAELHKLTMAYKEPNALYEVPYLFVRVPLELTQELCFFLHLLTTRRVRYGKSTIFIYDGSWKMMTFHDKCRVLNNMQGDGSYNSLKVHNFQLKKEETNVQS